MSFYEDFRPTSLKEMVGRKNEIKKVLEMSKNKNGIPHLLLHGIQGTGKTTFAINLAKEILKEHFKGNFFEFNGSDDRGIDIVRFKIKDLAMRRPFNVKYKIILIDEADDITADAQRAFKRIIEKYQLITRFIFTANHPHKLIEPILSRFVQLEFKPLTVKDIALYLKKSMLKLGDKRYIKSDKEYITIAKKANGDMRNAFGLLEGMTDIKTLETEITLDNIRKLSKDKKIELVYKTEPDILFKSILDDVIKHKEWKLLKPLAECNHRMNHSLHKVLFLMAFVEQYL